MNKKKLLQKNRVLFQNATATKLVMLICILSSSIVLQRVVAQGFLDRSAVANYLPDSLRKEYPAPMLADDDVIFALDSTGNSLYINFASNREHVVVVVVDPTKPKDSALIWRSEPLEGRIDYCYAADINGDQHEEIVVSTRKTGAGGWNRVHIWRWSLDNNPDSVIALAPCSDTLNTYFQAYTKIDVIDTGAAPDGILEVVITSIVGGGGLVNRDPTTIRTVFYWTGKEYCVERSPAKR